jgi:hypothetical protein
MWNGRRPQVGEGEVGDADVVRDDVALRQPRLREEELVGVRDRNVVTAYAHGASIVDACWKGSP